ncbi:DUF4259 domain-containing protein [Kitasatospora sp. NPDC085879]|uniref:DUF4259 domain-containing protein n=1 Tax=Kitasatospora sp. NPDC085879 TaxID=3154769 RepID=UPI00341268CB
MGTWDIGPFENDTAADWANTLDDTAPGDRERLIRGTLIRAARNRDVLGYGDGVEAVAAAALVASQCPGGEPVTTVFGPEETLPTFAADLRLLAADALDRVLTEESDLAELWDESVNGPRWRQSVGRVRAVLGPPPPPQAEALFEM